MVMITFPSSAYKTSSLPEFTSSSSSIFSCRHLVPLECLYVKVWWSKDMNSFLFCIVFWICIFDIPRSFSIFVQRSREYFLCSQQKRSCFWKESLSRRVTWAIYFRCCSLQKLGMLFVFVMVRRVVLLYKNDQSRSSGSGTIWFDFFASFFAFKYSTETFFVWSR